MRLAKQGLIGLCVAIGATGLACKGPAKRNGNTGSAAVSALGSAVEAAPGGAGSTTPATESMSMPPTFHFEIGVYHFAALPEDARATARKVLTDAGVQVLDDRKEISALPSAHIVDATLTEYVPPPLTYLQTHGRGLSDVEKAEVQHPAAATLLVFDGPAAAALATYRTAMRAVQTLEHAAPGAIMDDSSRNVLARAVWAELAVGLAAVPPKASDHFVIDAYQDRDLLRLVTIGLQKFGLPDLVVEQVTHGTMKKMASLINLVAQTLLEGGRPNHLGELQVDLATIQSVTAKASLGPLIGTATGRGIVTLRAVPPADGDAENTLWEITFAGPIETLQQRQAALVMAIVGMPDEFATITHDAAVLAASAKARTEVLLLKPKFTKRRPDMEHLSVKAPFKTSTGGNEWMWVEVVRWPGTTIEGILDNTPVDVPQLKLGAHVRVNQADIFDYVYTKADGSKQGDETQALMHGQADTTDE